MTKNPAIHNNSIRENIYHIIGTIVPLDDVEEEHISNTCLWILSDAPLFRIKKPDVPNKHLVCNFVLFDEKYKKILMTDHKASRQWRPTGGHMESDEDPTETVKRECMEELKIQADFLWPDPLFLNAKTSIDQETTHIDQETTHIDVGLWYVLKGDSQASYEFDEAEFHEVRWFGFDEIPYEKSDPHMRRFIQKLKNRI